MSSMVNAQWLNDVENDIGAILNETDLASDEFTTQLEQLADNFKVLIHDYRRLADKHKNAVCRARKILHIQD